MLINSPFEVVYIWTIAGSLSDTLSGGFRWLSLVIAVYTWLSLVILGYRWIYLVIPGYLMSILSGRDFLQMMGKIIANVQTISHIFRKSETIF